MKSTQITEAMQALRDSCTTMETVAASMEAAARALRDDIAIDSNVERVRDQLAARACVGLAKYGTTTERTDLSLVDWLQHAQEEAMDLAVYIERLKTLIGSLSPDGFAVVITNAEGAKTIASCWPTKGAADHDARNCLAPGASISVRPMVCIDKIIQGGL